MIFPEQWCKNFFWHIFPFFVCDFVKPTKYHYDYNHQKPQMWTKWFHHLSWNWGNHFVGRSHMDENVPMVEIDFTWNHGMLGYVFHPQWCSAMDHLNRIPTGSSAAVSCGSQTLPVICGRWCFRISWWFLFHVLLSENYQTYPNLSILLYVGWMGPGFEVQLVQLLQRVWAGPSWPPRCCSAKWRSV